MWEFAAEVYPSSVRSSAHGMSAAVGKVGALIPTVVFNYISNPAKFWLVRAPSAAACMHALNGLLRSWTTTCALSERAARRTPCRLDGATQPYSFERQQAQRLTSSADAAMRLLAWWHAPQSHALHATSIVAAPQTEVRDVMLADFYLYVAGVLGGADWLCADRALHS